MTKEEAAKFAERCVSMTEISFVKEFYRLAAAALRGPTREMVEKMRGEWEAVPRFGVYDTACSKCGYSPGIRFFSSDFCPACGAPMTDEAVEMVMERLEEMQNDQ